MKICNDRYLIQSHSQVLIQTDPSRKGWGAVCQGISTGAHWSKEEQLLHINVLELKAVKLALLNFNKQKSLKAVHFSSRQHHWPILPRENGGDGEPNVSEIKKRNLAVSLETPDHNYLRISSKFFECGGRLAVSKQQGPSERKLCPKVFQQVCQRRGTPKVYLFASRLSHQLPQYFASKPDPFSQGIDTLR